MDFNLSAAQQNWQSSARALMRDLGFSWEGTGARFGGVVAVNDARLQAAITELRTAGLNIMMSMKDERKPVSFVEDAAVPLEHLADYTARLTAVFEKHGTKGTWYAHAGSGCLHVRPVLNLKLEKDLAAMRAIAELEAYNKEHGITPATVKKAILDLSPTSGTRDYYAVPKGPAKPAAEAARAAMDLVDQIDAIRQEMFAAAENLQFETAARLRDELKKLQALDPDAAARASPGSRSDRPPARRSDRPPARRSDRPPSFKGRAAGRRR